MHSQAVSRLRRGREADEVALFVEEKYVILAGRDEEHGGGDERRIAIPHRRRRIPVMLGFYPSGGELVQSVSDSTKRETNSAGTGELRETTASRCWRIISTGIQAVDASRTWQVSQNPANWN